MSISLPSTSPALSEYNILVLGETQSGKSSLIQCMRKYAYPPAVIDTTALGTGFLSHTMEVKTETIITDLPEHYVANQNGDVIDYRKFLKTLDGNVYGDLVNMRKDLEMKKGDSRLPKIVKFNVIDTPGLNATGGDNEKHVHTIFHALNEVKAIHLLIITIASGPFTQGLQDAIKHYADMFPDFSGIITFVHTRFDYKNSHPAFVQETRAIDLKAENLHRILGRTSFPHFKIDCNIHNKRPIRECITQNTIQEILELATFNRPVDMVQTVVHKTRKMCDIDQYLKCQFESAIAGIETRWLRHPSEGKVLAEIFRNETKIHELEARIKVLDEFFVHHNVAQPEVLFEARLDMVCGAVGKDQTITVRCQESGAPGISIERDLLCHKIQLVKEIGRRKDGESWESWSAYFRPTSSRHCVLHVKIYTTRREKYRTEIEEKLREYYELLCKLQEAIQRRQENARLHETWPQQIKDAVVDHAEKVRVLGILASEFLVPEVFNALMDAEVYIGNMSQCLGKVQEVCMDMVKTGLKVPVMQLVA
ncbi:hypothetical protein BGZ82_008275 [Podila clonocystis]|nr:hypothetical protein BGZ82_008275 [Podila clonocystis]